MRAWTGVAVAVVALGAAFVPSAVGAQTEPSAIQATADPIPGEYVVALQEVSIE